MEEFAIDELYSLTNRIDDTFNLSDPVALYICSIFSELAYCLVPQHEIDQKKRAKIIPSGAYESIIRANKASHIGIILRGVDDPDAFVLFDRGVLAVGARSGSRLFIAFRGTKFLYEWITNVRSNKINVIVKPYQKEQKDIGGYYAGKRHAGFAEESYRIAWKIRKQLDEYDLSSVTQIIFTGHSLGGAVASLVEPNFRNIDGITTRLCVFGTPRFTELIGYDRCYPEPYTHVRRKKDQIPTVPPRKLGYADHPLEVGTNGEAYLEDKFPSNVIHRRKEWIRFLISAGKHHKIDKYRKELAATVGSRYVNTRLSDYPMIKKEE